MNNKRNPGADPFPKLTGSDDNGRLMPSLPIPGFIDLRILRLAVQYPYMFYRPDLTMVLRPEWFCTFERLCSSIDALLGENKQDFHWTLLHSDTTAFCWYWHVMESSDACVGMIKTNYFTTFMLPTPNGDMCSRLRQSIAQAVQSAMEEALAIGYLYERLQVRTHNDKRS